MQVIDTEAELLSFKLRNTHVVDGQEEAAFQAPHARPAVQPGSCLGRVCSRRECDVMDQLLLLLEWEVGSGSWCVIVSPPTPTLMLGSLTRTAGY